MRSYPQFSFWISTALAKIFFYRILVNRAKNTFVFSGYRPEEMRVSQTISRCAERKRSNKRRTVLNTEYFILC